MTNEFLNSAELTLASGSTPAPATSKKRSAPASAQTPAPTAKKQAGTPLPVTPGIELLSAQGASYRARDKRGTVRTPPPPAAAAEHRMYQELWPDAAPLPSADPACPE